MIFNSATGLRMVKLNIHRFEFKPFNFSNKITLVINKGLVKSHNYQNQIKNISMKENSDVQI